MHLYKFSFFVTILCLSFVSLPLLSSAQGGEENSKFSNLPQQTPPPSVEITEAQEQIFNFGPSTNLIRLLQEIRDLTNSGNIQRAQKMA